MYCPECGQQLPDDAARCTRCRAHIDMPLRRPEEMWEHWRDRVNAWVENANQVAAEIFAEHADKIPNANVPFRNHPDYRGQTTIDIYLQLIQNARRDRAFVTVMKARVSPYAPQDRETLLALRAKALALNAQWLQLVGNDWLQKDPMELGEWAFTYEVIRDTSKDGTATYEEVRRQIERSNARQAARAAGVTVESPRRRGILGRLRGRG